MGIFDIFNGDEGWLLPNDSIADGPYREVLMLVGDFPTQPSTLEALAEGAGYRLMNVKEIAPLPGWDGYYHYVGVITADFMPKPLSGLIAPLGLHLAVAKKRPVGLVEQSSLEASWIAGNTAGSAGKKLVDDISGELEDITGDLTQEVDKALEKGTEALGLGTKVQVEVPWNKVLLVGAGIAALIWYAGRKRKKS